MSTQWSSLQVGISSGTLRASALTARDVELVEQYAIRALEIGYEHAGPALADTNVRAQLVAVLRDVAVASLHAPYRPERDLSLLDESRRKTAVRHAAEALSLASELGAGLVVLHGSEEKIYPAARHARLDQAHKSLSVLVALAADLDLRLALETLPPAWLPAGSTEAWQMLNGLDPERIGFCLDSNHANLTGDLGAITRSLGPRLWSLHISDNDGIDQRHWMPMRGIIDWRAFLQVLDEVGYAGPFIYELDVFAEGVERGLETIGDNVKKLLQLKTNGD